MPAPIINGEAGSSVRSKLNESFTDFSSHSGAGGAVHGNAVAAGAAGFMSGADKTKLDGVATSATANAADSVLLARANHTGTQAIATVVGLQDALDGAAAPTVVCTWEQSRTTHLPASYTGRKYFITDVGEYGSEWTSDGALIHPLGPITLAAQTLDSPTAGRKSNGDTDWGSLFAYVLPAGLLVGRRALEMTPAWVYPNSAATKSFRVVFGPSTLYNRDRTTTAAEYPLLVLAARESAAAQIFLYPNGAPSVNQTAAPTLWSVDCSVDQTLLVEARWPVAGDGLSNIALQSMRLRLVP